MKRSLLILTSLISWHASAAYGTPTQPVPATPVLTTEVPVTGTPGLTAVLADTFGRTLYVFDPDQSAGKPACNGKCAEVWAPYTVTPEEVAALNRPDTAIQKRDSGLNQLTYDGRPVYLFNMDRAVGDIKGDGIGGVWHVIAE